MSENPDLLSSDETYVLCHWSVQAVAESMRIDEDDARDLLAAACDQGRLAIRGNSYFCGVEVDGRWVVVEGRARITLATREWQTLRDMERQFDDAN